MDAPVSKPSSPRRRYVPAVGPRLARLLQVVLALFSLLALNGIYLAAVTFEEWRTGQILQNVFYSYSFLLHLVLGILFIGPFVVFGVLHIKNAHKRPNRRAVRAGLGLFAAGLMVIVSGLLLLRVEGLVEVKDPGARGVIYWAHVAAPLLAAWLFILHRLAGEPIRWKVGGVIGGVSVVLAVGMVLLHSQDPKLWNVQGPASGEKYFFPSLARTATGGFIPASALQMNEYCKECHGDAYDTWEHSVHRASSFSNPAYLFSVRETRKVGMERDGTVQISRFCAGCHDPVPFFSGAFDDPKFDDVGHPTAKAGITCTVCHSITQVGVRGNAEFTIEEASHYPFAFSQSPFLQWVNRQLIKAKPALHKKTFLKPLHKTAEFCGACHKVHLPEELNRYKWLRGQNHYDAFLISGVSGHGVSSFYYPPKAEESCNSCHMPLRESEDFGARVRDDTGKLKVHDHLFPSANTAVPQLLGWPQEVIERHKAFTEKTLRVDIFGIKEGGVIDGELHAPLRASVPSLEPGRRYLFEVVVRTLKVGHLFTQGTADSNEVWLDVTARSGDRRIGRSGGRDADGGVDPWSHFVNAYVLDREGNRIDRRNAQDIFVPLYNHQIPPGAADVVHYALEVPADASGTLDLEVKLQYRKFDTIYMKHIYGPERKNDLPIMTIASDRITFPIGKGASTEASAPDIPPWQRWNDYGIGLMRKGSMGARKGELRQAQDAFAEVERLGRADGPLNLARTYIIEGRLEEAVEALHRASSGAPPAPPWSVAWFTGMVNKMNSRLDEALESFLSVAQTRFEDARKRGFDFSKDYNLLNEIAETLYQRGNRERGDAQKDARAKSYAEAVSWLEKALAIDPENAASHYLLSQVYTKMGKSEDAERHRLLHQKYKEDDNAREQAVSIHRAANPAANHAAESVVIYDLQRPGAYELASTPPAAGPAGGGGR